MHISSAEFIQGVVSMRDPLMAEELPQIALVGRSNVGKSSIINLLTARSTLAKVGKKPGKTTELNFFLINNTFYLIDLPGYGYAKVTAEKKQKIQSIMYEYFTHPTVRPVCTILVLDIKAGLTALDSEMLDLLRQEGRNYIIVVNKTDNLNQKDTRIQLQKIREISHTENIIPISTRDTSTREILWQSITSYLA